MSKNIILLLGSLMFFEFGYFFIKNGYSKLGALFILVTAILLVSINPNKSGIIDLVIIIIFLIPLVIKPFKDYIISNLFFIFLIMGILGIVIFVGIYFTVCDKKKFKEISKNDIKNRLLLGVLNKLKDSFIIYLLLLSLMILSKELKLDSIDVDSSIEYFTSLLLLGLSFGILLLNVELYKECSK